MEKSLAVANELIRYAIDAKNPPTQMKLQKLLFFAHGWNLALFDGPLVDERFRAWKYGPVIPSVYHEFKSFGKRGIDRLGTEMVLGDEGILFVSPLVKVTGDTPALLHKIWEVFGGFNGTQLSDMTHKEGTPWYNAWVKSNYSGSAVINDEDIKKYFKSLRN